MQKAKRSGGGRAAITIARGLSSGFLGLGFAAPVLGILSGCTAPAPRAVSAGPEAVTTGQLQATVIAIRPVPAVTPQGGGAVLAALGQPAGPQAGAQEIILRTDQGNVLSIVQAAVAGLAPGARVVVQTGPHMEIVRPGSPVPST